MIKQITRLGTCRAKDPGQARRGGLRGCDPVCVNAYFVARKIAAIV
jgi:hypothetical protein